MGSLLRPVGPEPPRVYWVRRAAVVAGVLLVVAALAFVFRPQPQVPVAATPATPVATPSTTSASPSSSASASPSPTPTGPVACDATTTSLDLAGYQKVKQDGKQSFLVTVKNTGAQTCVLTLGPTTFTLAVTSGTDRIWTTEHCEKWAPSAKQKLKAGKAYEFKIGWPVSRSAEGCRTAKALLGPGTYVATATFAKDARARKPFVVTKA